MESGLAILRSYSPGKGRVKTAQKLEVQFGKEESVSDQKSNLKLPALDYPVKPADFSRSSAALASISGKQTGLNGTLRFIFGLCITGLSDSNSSLSSYCIRQFKGYLTAVVFLIAVPRYRRRSRRKPSILNGIPRQADLTK